MYAVVRRYTSASDVADIINKNRQSLEDALGGIPGLIAYYLVSTGNAVATVTISQDAAGAEESIRRAAEWVKQYVPAEVGLSAPEITRGDVLLSISK